VIKMSSYGAKLWVLNKYWEKMTASQFREKYAKDRQKMLGVKVPTPQESEKFFDKMTKRSEKMNDPITGKSGDLMVPLGTITICLECYRKMVDNVSGDASVIRPVYHKVVLNDGRVAETPYVFYPNEGFVCPICKRRHKVGITITGYVSLKSKWHVLGGMKKPLKIDGERVV